MAEEDPKIKFHDCESQRRSTGNEMSIATETAAEYFRLAALSAERGEVAEAIRYADKAQSLLLRPSVEIEPAGKLIGEHTNFQLLGKVLAAKAEKAISTQIVE